MKEKTSPRNDENDHLDLIREFWNGRGRVMATLFAPEPDCRQIFDVDECVERNLGNLEAQIELSGLRLPIVMVDFGTISTAKYWGGDVIYPKDAAERVFIEPAATTIDEALALEPRAVDDPEMDGAKAARIFASVSEAAGSDDLWLRTPDMQGVLNTAGLVMDQEELFMAMYEEPDKVHRFLGRVADHLVDLLDYLKRSTDGRICGNIWPYTYLPADMGVSFTEDLMPLLSADNYKKFGIPHVERFSREFGGVHIHCCGKWGHHAENLKRSAARIRAVEFHHPFTTAEELAPLADEAVLIPYASFDRPETTFGSLVEYYDHLLDSTPTRYRYWFPFTDASPWAADFLKRRSDFQ